MDRLLPAVDGHRDGGHRKGDPWALVLCGDRRPSDRVRCRFSGGRAHWPMTAIEMVDEYGAEQPDEFAARIRSLLDDLSVREGAGLLVSHAGVGRMIQTLLRRRSPFEFREQALPENASLFLIGSE